jgi:hypothetical protein
VSIFRMTPVCNRCVKPVLNGESRRLVEKEPDEIEIWSWLQPKMRDVAWDARSFILQLAVIFS